MIMSGASRLMRRAWVLASPLAPRPVVLSTMLIAGGCAKVPDSPTGQPSAGSESPATPYEIIDPARFANPTHVDNPWLPLKPGMRYVYEGTTVEDDGRVLPHRVVINVTDMTKVVGGIESRVTWDLDYADGKLVEAELAFYAQDDDGNVWRMGEYPEEYVDGKFLAAPAWVHGRQEARAGIMMMAQPATGTRSYAQGWGPAVDWTDRGRVDGTGLQVTVPAGSYPDVIVVAETSVSEPGAEQLKYYARGVGNVKVGWRGEGEKTRESLELISVDMLDDAGMAEVRAAALKMEAHAYQVSPEVYAHTAPLLVPAGVARSAEPAGTTGGR